MNRNIVLEKLSKNLSLKKISFKEKEIWRDMGEDRVKTKGDELSGGVGRTSHALMS